MDSDQPLCRHTISSNGRAYASSQLTSASMPERLLSSLKFSSRDSPNSPLSTQFDCDTNIATPSDSIEPQSSTENNLSGASPSSYTSSSIEANSLLCQRSSPSDHDSSLVALSSGGTALSQEVFLHGPESMRHALLKLETVLMDEDEEVSAPVHPYLAESGQPQLRSSMVWKQASTQGPDIRRTQAFSTPSSSPAGYRRAGEGDLSQAVHFKESKQGEVHRQGNPSGNLKQLLVDCARALSENQVGEFDRLAEEARSVVSVSGEPIQRLGCYMLEGLVARKECSGTNIYRALRCKEPIGKDLLSFMHILYEVCPYLKFGYMAANGAIAEACRNEERIHIVDFQICQGTQWMTLLQALAARPRGPPHVRITGIDDPMSKYARGDSLELVGKRLAAISAKFNITVEFNPVPVFAPDVKLEMLKIIPGEALAVNFPLQLHHTPDESVDVENPRDGLLRMVRSLHPKVTTLVEQESNTNTTPFLTRFIETMDYYSAMFESIDVTMPRDRKERINVEQHCLAKDIVNIIACEGKERVERHELLGKWKSRFTMAGFRPYPLSSYVNSVIRNLLGCYSENYTLVEKDGAMLLGWKSRMLVSASAWY